jgi:hypothetical protein
MPYELGMQPSFMFANRVGYAYELGGTHGDVGVGHSGDDAAHPSS